MRTKKAFGLAAGLCILLVGWCMWNGPRPERSFAEAPLSPAPVYGEWRIRVKPDKGAEYARLIQEKGLPRFREAGGRMVGWWNTLVGDLYEHVTIWEYDGLPAFEKAVAFLSKEPRFAEFAALRDPLLTGEVSRFLRLVSPAEKPALLEKAKFVVHEVHRVPFARREAYQKAVVSEALPILRKHGFRWVGPFQTAIGRWTETTYLWLYESLAERDAKLAALADTEDGRKVDRLLLENVEDVTTRLLVPAAFAY
jgi:hypothetical protein